MRTFAQKQKPTQKAKSAVSERPSRVFSAQSPNTRSILHLQHTIGNQAGKEFLYVNSDNFKASLGAPIQSDFGHNFSRIAVNTQDTMTIQPKLTINTPGDIYEQEADRVADQVLRMPESRPQTQRTCPCGGGCPKCRSVQESHEQLQTKRVQAYETTETVPPIVLDEVSSPGRPLESTTRRFMESRFGHDFSKVRVHTDTGSVESVRAVGARAYTIAPKIVFGAGQYAPGTTEGRRLLAHELAHVIQQQGPLSRVNGALLQRQVPQDITAQVGPVSVQGGLINDFRRNRMSIIIGPNDTLRTIAQRLLSIWNNAQPFTPPGTATPRSVTQLTVEQLAKGLLVYNRYYLKVPSMDKWKVGLRFPLPIDVNQVTGQRTLHPDVTARWANGFDPAWTPILDMTPAAMVAPTQATLQQSVQTFLREAQTLTARGAHLSTRAISNAREAEPFIQEVFRQAASEAFDLALAFMDWIVTHQFDVLVSQTAGQGIINTIRNALATAPASPSASQQQSLARANRLLNRLGVFSTATARRFRDIYVTEVPGDHCMEAVYHGSERLFSEGVSQSIQDQVSRESREVMRQTGRNTNHMDRIMETVRARGMAGPETQLVHQAASNTWQPDPETTILAMMTRPTTPGWYFFGLSLHAAYHSVTLAVDKTDPTNPHIYWMDQHSRGFTDDVTGTLMDKMRSFRPSYGFAPSRLWQIMPAAHTLIMLE